jgi:integrase
VGDFEKGECMSLYKRGNTWWVDVTTASGQRFRESTGTSNRKAAQEYHDKLKADAWRVEKLGDRPRRTWDEAAKRFLDESEGKASLRKYEYHVAFWTRHFREQPLDTITRQRAAELVEAKAHTPATRNRYIATLRAILKKAAGVWEWLDRAPKLMTYQEPKQRIRWITREEAETLLAQLPEWLAAMARFALATGLRQANVYGLEWSQIDLERRVAWVHPDQAKARRAIGVPLNEDAVGVIRKQLGKHLKRVFVDAEGRPLDVWSNDARKGWETACKRAEIEDFRWHDLRHTWASWHVQRGTPLYVLKELGGWQTLEMVNKYAHLSSEHLSSYAERVTLCPVTSQIRHSDVKKEGSKLA